MDAGRRRPKRRPARLAWCAPRRGLHPAWFARPRQLDLAHILHAARQLVAELRALEVQSIRYSPLAECRSIALSCSGTRRRLAKWGCQCTEVLPGEVGVSRAEMLPTLLHSPAAAAAPCQALRSALGPIVRGSPRLTAAAPLPPLLACPPPPLAVARRTRQHGFARLRDPHLLGPAVDRLAHRHGRRRCARCVDLPMC